MRRVCGSPHSSLRAESDLPAWKVWGCLLRRTVSQPVVHQAAENIFRLITCAANEHAFSLRQASKQKKNKTTTKKSTSKQNEENKSYKLTLKPEPSWCLFPLSTTFPVVLSGKHCSAQSRAGEALHSPEEAVKASGQPGWQVCCQEVPNKCCASFSFSSPLLSALSVCMAGVQRKSQTNSDAFPYSRQTKSEKALRAAFAEGLQCRLIL